MHTKLRQPEARIASLLSVFLFISILAPAFAQEAPPPILNPNEYASPSGKYILSVNPSDLYGRGKGTYRLTLEESKLDTIHEDWYAQPGTARRWVLCYEKVSLVDGRGGVVRTIMRRPDGFWLEQPQHAATAPDGSIAVVSGTNVLRSDNRELAVSIYSPQGEPIFSFMLPRYIEWSFPRIAFDGKRIALTAKTGILFFTASGKLLGQFVPAQFQKASWTPFMAPDAQSILLFDDVKTFHRFELP